MSTETIVYLNPAEVVADDNSRYGLKQSRIDALAASIIEQGGVLQPVEVTSLEGGGYRLTSGFYRHAAVTKLNADGAGLELPSIVRDVDDKARLMHQIAENSERENMSPMDTAVAIRRLLDAGTERKEIRRIFARSTGKKGTGVQPASNAWVNIIVSLLELPKAIQVKIHEGAVGVAAAYELGKVAPDKRQAVLDRAEAERTRQQEQEEKDEEKFLHAESKVAEAEAKLTEVLTEEGELRKGVEAAAANVKTATDAFRALQKEDYLNFPEDRKTAHRKALSEAEAAVKAAQKASKDFTNKLAKHLESKHKVEEATEAARQRLEEAKSAKLKAKSDKGRQAGTAVGPADVKKAAAAEGEGTGHVALNAGEMRAAAKELASLKATPKVAAIGDVLTRIFSGELTNKLAAKELAFITGELVRPVAAPAAAAKGKKR